MSDIQNYYKNYFKNGGVYRLEDYKGSSRVLMITQWLREHLKPGDRVLDIGCGDGTYAELMPEFKWTGLDINEETAVYPGTRYVKNIEETPYDFEEGHFAAVVCSEVLEHLWDPDSVHREASRLLKRGGLYVLSTPNFDWIDHHLGTFRQVVYDPKESHTKEHIRFYTFEAHEKLLEAAGFTIADAMGADLQYGKFFAVARHFLKEVAMKDKTLGEIDYLLGRMFPMTSHTIGILGVKR